MSTPKAPKADPATVKLQQEQLAAINKQRADAASAIAARRKRIKSLSVGRRSLLRTGERGIEEIQSQALPTAPAELTPQQQVIPAITGG